MADKRGKSDGDPPHSRLFIKCDRQITEDDIKAAFSKIGEIKDVCLGRDKVSKAPRGFAYLQFVKTTQAAEALETMNGKRLINGTQPIKITVAASREERSAQYEIDEDRLTRLFVLVPKEMSKADLHNLFERYGDIVYASLLKHKRRDNKVSGCVKFEKFSQAAAAYEQCDRQYQAVFAHRPRLLEQNEPVAEYEPTFNNSINNAPDFVQEGDIFTSVRVISSPTLNQDQIWKLFDIIPDLDYCQTNERSANLVTTVVYKTPKFAAYAVNKLHGFEYPVGNRLIVKPWYEQGPRGNFNEEWKPYSASGSHSESFNFGADNSMNNSMMQPVISTDSQASAKCFIECNPRILPEEILRDILRRFGPLIDVQFLPQRNALYVTFGSPLFAQNAIMNLNGRKVFGVDLRVSNAGMSMNASKRMRMT